MTDTTQSEIVQQVGDFYNAYIAAMSSGSEGTAATLRSKHFTPELQQSLADWGVVHGEGAPTAATARYCDSGEGHVVTYVTLTWGTGPDAKTSELAVRTDMPSGQICQIK